MRLVRHLADLPYEELVHGSVVTIGAFDGLHLGHEQLLARVLAEARSSGRPASSSSRLRYPWQGARRFSLARRRT